ncbi:PolC-type DNA polymerase III [Lachnoclostridium phytofermentans]|nr:PolC-type DNA polymerase III [Lachnoclostridium phytofermentans]
MLFFEVFDTLNVEKEIYELFSDISVLKALVSKNNGNVHIYIQSTHLISRKQIKMMEFQLQKQLFSSTKSRVKLIETYQLSSQYTPESLWNMHSDNILEELNDSSVMNYNILRMAEISFDGYKMIFKLPDTFLNQKKSEEIKVFLEPMFEQRFCIPVDIRFEFYELIEEAKEEEEYPQARREKAKQNASGSMETSGEVSDEIRAEIPFELSSSNVDGNNLAGKDSIESKSELNVEKKKEEKKQIKDDKFSQSDKKNSAYDKAKAYKKKLPDDPDIIYGRPFEGDSIPIKDIQEEIGEVVIRGKILFTEERELRNEKFLISFNVTDFTDTISAKIFVRTEEIEDIRGQIKKGMFIRLKGMALYDTYSREITINSIIGIKKIPSFIEKRVDRYENKRVELHAHTMMSDMDAVVDPQALVKTAFEWGHKAVAITDHGVVQAFPEASHAINPKDYKDDEEKMQRAKDFKIIYGMEAYVVDDMKDIVQGECGQGIEDTCVVFDIETTGFSSVKDKIIEIGAVKIQHGTIVDRFSTFINPEVPIPYHIQKLTSITDEMVIGSRTIEEILPEFLSFCEGCYLVAHNASFDIGFITKKAEFLNIPLTVTSVDTVGLARVLLNHLNNFKLDTVAKALSISLENHHRAVDDAGCTAEIYLKFLEMLRERGIETLAQINRAEEVTPDVIKKMPTYHAIILCQNDIGRVNLYRMVSYSHINYFQRRPRIPKSVLMKHREGLLIGSACEAGELYQAILRNSSEGEIVRLANFYDYYEIQPLGNNQFMIESEKIDISSEEELKEINRKIIALGEEYNKPVVATCDVHFLNPEDEVYRRIIMAAKGFSDADNQAPLYFRTTEEMLEEFSYLGKEKAEEVVITNTNKVCDMIEKISPVRPDKCAPVIEDSDKTLRDICYEKAHSMYGPDLPKIVADRLEHELKSIINNGFAVMYIIAQKLVWKSNEDGYLVGSRGSVGSSFAATMSGITEVNPLPAHYYCPNCHFSDFESEEVKAFGSSSGCDMPDRDCPVCGQPLAKDGHNIPFETFLGFNGDKEPDIDLNFSGEYQSKAHDYTEVIFGKGQTFRAGTIGTLADKTAFGYAKKYYEEKSVHKRVAEINRIVEGCVGVRRTTGQHPGGIIVLPLGEEIYSFTPVQRPANDMTTKTVTTHFDYHSIDHNLLKLDILGHDDPTMIRMLEDLTGIDAKTIRMDDQKVISLFKSTESLGIRPEDIGGCDLGSLGLPELGTDFVMQMLRDTKPQSFSDMIRISGLSHGTDVWLNNTQTLISEGKCTLSTAICTRDDIMTYLISEGVENGLAFKIMESVRKGKGLTPEMEEAMVANGVPDWYIWSCKRIKYMFPKAHACAYVMMAFRIAYFKVYYPLAYYTAYFSIRATAFNYELMCLGRERLDYHMAEYKRRMGSNDPAQKLTKKEEDTLKDMKVVQEMYARGFDFLPIDVYTAKAHHFQIIDGKLMPALSTIDGLGDKAADQVVEAVKDGKFLSRDDFKTRCKISGTVVDLMGDLGLLGDLPMTNQISLMDFLM